MTYSVLMKLLEVLFNRWDLIINYEDNKIIKNKKGYC